MIKRVRFKAGEIILRENDEGETAYIIEQGRVRVTRDLEGRAVHLADLGVGEPFGEMGMIDEKPRSATVTAVEDTTAREIHRDEFFRSLQTDPDVALNLLRALFERLREASSTILQLRQSGGDPAGDSFDPATGAEDEVVSDVAVHLTGLTPQAEKHLSARPFPIDKFPFRIGRKSSDPLVHNDLGLADFLPFQVSRHHLAIVKHGSRVGVQDRGSSLGSLVDGRQLGGRNGNPGPLFFKGPEGKLVVGTKRSPFQFTVVIGGGEENPKKPSLWEKK